MQLSFSKNLALLAGAATLASAIPLQTAQVKRSFNLGSDGNVVSYWGNAPTNNVALKDICSDSYTDIVILTFGEYQNNKWTLVSTVPPTAADVQVCQKAGKKVMVSLGGGNMKSLKWDSDDDATKGAEAAYNEFLTTNGAMKLAFDGIDLDIEANAPAHWDTFAKYIKSKKSSNQILSAAPQCFRPDGSIPVGAQEAADFVIVQFYNNPGCGHGSTGFIDSLKTWSAALPGQKVLVGALGSSGSGGNYIDSNAIAAEIKQVQGLGLKNFGGYAFWDASTAKHNGDFIQGAAKVLKSGSTSSSSSSLASLFLDPFKIPPPHDTNGNGNGCKSSHTVATGDTCYAIAKAAGIDTAKLTSLNSGLDCNALAVGAKVCTS